MISEFPLFVFTLLGGMAAGSYVLAGFLPRKEEAKPWLLPLVALVLLAVSGVALLLHLGHPERMLNAFSHLGAGITLEGYTMILFGVVVLVDLVVGLRAGKPNRVVGIVGSIAGALLLCAMGFAYGQFLGTPAWNSFATYPLFIVGGLALGAPLAALFVKGGYTCAPLALGVIVAEGLTAASLVAAGVHFAHCGLGIAPFIVGAVIVVMAAIVAAYARKSSASWCVWCVLVLTVIGVAIARYAFYCI